MPIFNIAMPGDAIWSVVAIASDFNDVQDVLAELKDGTATLTTLFAAAVNTSKHHPEVFIRDDAQDLEDMQTWKYSVIDTREYADDQLNMKETVTELPDNVGFRQVMEDNAQGKKELNKLMKVNPPSGHTFCFL
ncbi:hypothetical protein AYL99_06335 [Fonsecaea erecta]|uniref:Uncharacterized protein n=1 Tax=Fonsecaea erecta TaxID=1367422 RepID=A0A178ZGW3_9EURO|nr:hypothetical protein AYL99_06335 [Fonsecaea erecta]OAP59037.1 hypothetical protein AYL99_06335 [Fonsecaea erecta]